MELLLDESNNGIILKLTGELNICRGEELKEILTRFLASSGDLGVEMSGVTEIDACSLQMIIAAQRSLEKMGKALKFASISESLAKTARMAGVHNLFNSTDTRY